MDSDKVLQRCVRIEDDINNGVMILSYDYSKKLLIEGALVDLGIKYKKVITEGFDGFECDIMEFSNVKDSIPNFIKEIEESGILEGDSITNYARKRKIEKIILRINSNQ